MTTPAQSEPPIRLERHGTIAILIPAREAGILDEGPLAQAATAVLTPLAALPPTSIIMDLGRMDYFGSRFIGFLIRCHKQVKESGGQMVLAGASGRIHEVLRLSALDRLWPFYEDRAQALQALTSTD